MASPPSSTASGGPGKTAGEVECARRDDGSSSPVNFFFADFLLRLLLFASSLAALIVLVTSKQTKMLPVPTGNPISPFVLLLRSAKFEHSPAFVYLLAALSVTCLYSAFTMLTSASTVRSPSPSTALLFTLVVFDALMAGILAAAAGAGGAVAYIGVKGNSHVNWNKVCNAFDKFCRHIGSAVGVSIVASAVLVALVILSAYSLYRRASR